MANNKTKRSGLPIVAAGLGVVTIVAITQENWVGAGIAAAGIVLYAIFSRRSGRAG
ncbi:hypothetical protein [Actinoplanes sp. NPDC023714]|uniref:hypothetical protein n=1 Tax=Actinoplanes sp. NPDC023714 TaxID=3154322 RepID=UPI0033F91A74